MKRTLALVVSALVILLVAPCAGEIVTVPPGLNPGDQYRIIFVTDRTANAESPEIDTFNGFIRREANRAPRLVDLQTTWHVIGSTQAIAARDNTNTNPATESGVPIYGLDGLKIADDNADLWDGSLDNSITVTQIGGTDAGGVFTGTEPSGIKGETFGDGGSATIGDTGFITDRWISSSSTGEHNFAHFYGISGVLSAPPDSDLDRLPDFVETNTGVFISEEDTGTDPNNSDTDGDGLRDGHEVLDLGLNPNKADTDDDGFDDPFELSTGFDPASATSTPDTLSSIHTAVEFRFNAANGESYRVEASTDLEDWATVEGGIAGTGGVIVRFYSTEGTPERFFRARRE